MNVEFVVVGRVVCNSVVVVVNGDESTPNINSALERDFGLCKNCLLCLSCTESFNKLRLTVGFSDVWVTGGRVGSIGLNVVVDDVVLTTGLVCSSVINVLNKVDLVVGKVDVVVFSGWVDCDLR